MIPWIKKSCDVYRGLNLLGLPQEKVQACPLHSDSTPSFHVYGDGETWYCFSAKCRKGGDVIALVAAVHKCKMKEAAMWLASQLGLTVDYRQPGAAVRGVTSIVERARSTSQRRDPALKTYLEARYVFLFHQWQREWEARWSTPTEAVAALERATDHLLTYQAQCASLRDVRLTS